MGKDKKRFPFGKLPVGKLFKGRGMKRGMGFLLAAALLFNTLPSGGLVATAAASERSGTGTCEHHPEHTVECGYTAAEEGSPCNHEHTDDCYIEVIDCTHEHDEDCYPQEDISDNDATPSDAKKREPENCPHICDEDSGCITKELNCQHEHDDECGYAPATEGTPCGYVCEICAAEDDSSTSGHGGQKQGETATPSSAEKASAVERVQAMIDALPEKITADNAEDVKAQLEAIDEAKAELTDEELDQLDITRYIEAAAELGGLDTPVLLDVTSSGTFGSNNDWSWELDDGGTLTITGTGDMPDFTWGYVDDAYTTGSPWYDSSDLIKEVVITGDVTSVGDCAFYGSAVTSAVLPDTVTSIGNKAFGNCTSLTWIELPSGLTDIGDSAFASCSSLAWIELPSGLTNIEPYAFSFCSSLALTELPSGLTNIESHAFYSCRSLALTELPDGIIAIGSWAFSFCSSLALTELPSGLTDIEPYAFFDCSSLALTELPSGITTIGGNAFQSCTSLTELTFTSSTAPTLWEDVFKDCENLTIYVPADGTGYTSENNWPTDRIKYLYNVTLETGGGTIADGKNVTMYAEGKGASLPTADDVTRTGYKFMGWYEDSSFSGSAVTEISGTETGNKTFYAKWEKSYTITVQSGGHGSASASPASAAIGEEITLTATPDTGYQFKAWEVISGGMTITGDKFTMPAEDVIVKATFEMATYIVTLETNGGTITDGKEVTSYAYGQGAVLPTAEDVIRTGYMFMGWYADSSFSGSAVTEISDTETGDKTFYAKWAAPVAEIVKEDGTAAYVTSLTDAFTYENRDITVVTLLEDVDVGSEYVYIREWNTCTLDLNGHTVSSTGVQTFFLIGGNLTIKDSKSGGIISAKSYAIYIDSGTLSIESGTVSGGCGIWHDGGKVTISGGTIIGSNGTSIFTTSETDTLKDMLAEGCAYYQDGVPVPLDANSTYLLGTVTVKECSHTGEGVCEYTHIDGATTHSKTCLACGYTEAAEDCQYTFADNVGTCQACGSTLTVTVTGTDGLTYDGTAKTLPVEVKVNNTAALTAGIDYTVTYANNTNAGEASVIVADKDGAWNFEQKFTIAKATVTITWTDTTQSVTYTGSAAAITAPTVSAENDLTVSTVPEYSYAEELSTEFKSGLPSDAGTYTVRASIAESDNLSAASADMMLIITPPENTVSVDITWGAMSFTYTDGAWDPDTHTNGEGGWTDGGSGWISVENSGSNVPVEVNCTYNTARTDISGSFTDGTDPVSEPVTLAVDETKKLWLILSGKPDGELDHTELGTVTVKITGGGE